MLLAEPPQDTQQILSLMDFLKTYLALDEDHIFSVVKQQCEPPYITLESPPSPQNHIPIVELCKEDDINIMLLLAEDDCIYATLFEGDEQEEYNTHYKVGALPKNSHKLMGFIIEPMIEYFGESESFSRNLVIVLGYLATDKSGLIQNANMSEIEEISQKMLKRLMHKNTMI